MTEQEKAIEAIKNDLEWHKKDLKPKYREYLNMAIDALEKTSDKDCSRCINKGKCAIYDNFNIDYCSDWESKDKI